MSQINKQPEGKKEKLNLLYEIGRFITYVARDGEAAASSKMKEIQLTYMEAGRLARLKSQFHPMRFGYVQSAWSIRFILRRGQEYERLKEGLKAAFSQQP